MRVRTDGKFFASGEDRFHFRAVSLTASQTSTPEAFRRSLQTARELGFTVVETPALPPKLVGPAAESGLHVLFRVEPPESGLPASRLRRRRTSREWASAVQRQLRPWYEAERLFGVVVTADPEVEFDASADARSLDLLVGALHARMPGLLVTAVFRAPVPLPAPHGLDFVTLAPGGLGPAAEMADVLDAAHRSAGDAPLVLGPLVPTSLDELDSYARVAVDRGTAGWWTALPDDVTTESVRSVVGRTVHDLAHSWPSVSLVICAYNAEETLEECLSACDRLDYPALEVLVIDDGSTDSTPVIVDAHPRVALVTVPHGGLSAARNAGYRAASGHLVAYLDSDAYPPQEWVHYLALALEDSPGVAGCGGPNVPPPDDPLAAQVVARSPGGPIPQLRSERRAVHVPGCNMAFTRKALYELGGFDEALWTASDDLEFGWRFNDAGYEIGYHPAALVWHHRRPGLRRYLKQQRGYGRSQAIVEARYPDRFPAGRRLRKLDSMLRRADGAESAAPTVAYRSLYWRERPLATIAHQWGLPAAVLLTVTVPLGLLRRSAALPGLAGLGYAAGLFAVDMYLSGSDNPLPEPTVACRASIAAHRLLRPLAFRWGHLAQTWEQRRS